MCLSKTTVRAPSTDCYDLCFHWRLVLPGVDRPPVQQADNISGGHAYSQRVAAVRQKSMLFQTRHHVSIDDH